MILKIRVIATKHFSIKSLPLQNKRESMDEIHPVKFIYSEKATKFYKIFPLL